MPTAILVVNFAINGHGEYPRAVPKVGNLLCNSVPFNYAIHKPNITTRFLIEELRNQGFIEDDEGTYKIIFINSFRHLQLSAFLEFLEMTAEELIEY